MSLPPSERQPCPNCGSKSRHYSVNLSARLDFIGKTYAEVTAASNERIQHLMSAQAQAAISREGSTAPESVEAPAGVAEGTGAAHEPERVGAALEGTIRGQSNASATLTNVAGELSVERDLQLQTAIQTLIEVVQVGQAQSAVSTGELNDLTAELVKWTRRIGVWTAVMLLVAGITAVVALVALIVGVHAALAAK
jgi:hypothetical protein